MRSLIHTFLCCLLLAGTGFTQLSFFTYTADEKYAIKDSVIIKNRNGQDISLILVRPAILQKPSPAILFYTTYHQGPGDAFFGKLAADRNYVGIVAYARGIRTNISNYTPYVNDGNDAWDVIDWISKQAWCDGQVGMFGGSYTGFVQWAAAKNLHPALKTIVPQVAVMPGFDAPMENNVPYSSAFSWAHYSIYKKDPLPNDFVFNWYEKGIAYGAMDSLAGYKSAIFQEWLAHPAYDNYWKSLVPRPEEYAKLNIPILTTTGYYDGSQIGNMEYVKQYFRYNTNPELYLVIGPYDHWGGQSKAAPELMGYKIDSVAQINMRKLAFDWFDYIFRKAPKPELLQDKINFQVMGTNTWMHVPSLRQLNTDTLLFYLKPANDQKHILSPSLKKKEWANFTSLLVDYKNRDENTQHNYFTPFITVDSLNAGNGIVYRTAPFKKELIVNGGFLGELIVEINKYDADISVAYYEEKADGSLFYLTRYLGRASYANDPGKRQLLTPNNKTKIQMAPARLVSRKFAKGSRLHVIVNLNKHPFDVVNYGSGKEVSSETINDAGEPMRIKWFAGSTIRVPVRR
jgi:putative CocE/NonD family hydrolase